MSDVLVIQSPDHALAAPSLFATIKLCPYAAINRAGWSEPESPYAKRGHLLHEAVYNDEAFERIDVRDKELVRMIREEFVEPVKANQGNGQIFYEQRLTLNDEDGRERTFGTVDFLAVNGPSALLYDWKYGESPVPPAAVNEQVRAYVAMAFQAYPGVNTVYAMVVQPAAAGGLDFDNQAEFTREKDYPELLKNAVAICDMAETATPESARPDPDACRWCNKLACKAYKDTMAVALRDWCDGNVVPGAPQGEPTPELIDYCDGALGQLQLLKDIVVQREAEMKKVIVAAGGSKNYFVRRARVTKTTDWKAVCEECGVPEDVVAAHTVERIGEQYAVRKTRKQ